MANKELSIRETEIPGLLVLDLVVHGDSRGWFKENWQRAKMTALGLPDFGPVQNNMSFNDETGVTRGLHAEPWDKLVSVASGKVFGAWVDLREGPTFGKVVTVEMGPETSVFVPRGVANGYQTLTDNTVYSYLVNEHWSADAKDSYSFVNLADETADIKWPIPLADAIISDADKAHPRLASAKLVAPKRTLIVGAGGQLGQALSAILPDADRVDFPDFDVTNPGSLAKINWANYDTIINASAYTAVDLAETEQGRRDAWAVNVTGVANLCRVAAENRITLVQVSSDYVFDGTATEHTEDEPFSPLGVYAQTKAASDALVALVPKHYILRTSWVIGEGKNFVRTMASLAERGISPTVVNDQFGRLTFTSDLAAGIVHLLNAKAPYGTYNLTNTGPVQSWADIAKQVFALSGRSADDVTPITTEEYNSNSTSTAPISPRPTHSALNLDKLQATGFTPALAETRLAEYLAS